MPTIPQLPPARMLSSDDEIPISQDGSACAVSVGDLLASTQPAIIIPSPSLLGRHSVGAGGPEGIGVGIGIDFSEGTIAADGSDHAGFPVAGGLIVDSDLVISDQGSQKLMPTAALRTLFSAGDNITINEEGVISASGSVSASDGGGTLGSILSLPLTVSLSAADTIPVVQGGTAYAVAYSNLLNGLTIDQAVTAGPVLATDVLWVGQGSSSMVAQTFGAIWSWIMTSLSQYRAPVSEITSGTALSYTEHNGIILIVTAQAVRIDVNFNSVGNGFQCDIVTTPSGSVVWGSGVVATDGGLGMPSNSRCRLLACSSSQGQTILASVFSTAVGSSNSAGPPGPVSNLAVNGVTSSSVALAWTAPTTGGGAAYYLVQYRSNGASSWTSLPTNPTVPSVSVTGLSASSPYDFQIAASNAGGTAGSYVQLLNISTATAGILAPGSPSGLSVGAVTSSSISLTWVAPSTGGAPTGYTVQSSLDGGSTWTSAVSFGNVTSGVIGGLLSGTIYAFRVAAYNSGGSSTYSPTSAYPTGTTVSSASIPGLPTNLSFPSTYSTSMTVEWTAPSGPVTGYNIQYRVMSTSTWTVVTSSTNQITITGLTASTAYEFQVQAVNGALASAYTGSVLNTTTAVASGIYKLTPSPTRQSPTLGWAGTTMTRANGQPASGYNVSDNSAAGDGAYPVPASVGFAWSSSNTVVPSATNAGSNGLSLDGHNLWFSWSVTYPTAAGNYYLWAIARDGAGNIGGTCVSPTPFTLQ
jgi:Fibronectin type III domain